MHHLARDLLRVRVAEHVPLPHDAAHAGELHAERLEDALPAFFKAFRTNRDLLTHLLRLREREPRVLPVTVREHHRRNLALDHFRLPKAARDVKARCGLEIDFFDRETIALDLAMNHRIERRLRRHRPQTLRDENLASHVIFALIPLTQRRRRIEGKIGIQVLRRLLANILRMSKRGKNGGEKKRLVFHGWKSVRHSNATATVIPSMPHEIRKLIHAHFAGY